MQDEKPCSVDEPLHLGDDLVLLGGCLAVLSHVLHSLAGVVEQTNVEEEHGEVLLSTLLADVQQ